MSTKKQELLHTQSNASEADNSESLNKELIQRTQVEDTPFWIIKHLPETDEETITLVIGKWKIADLNQHDSLHIKSWLSKNLWQTILKLIICISNDLKDEEKIK